MREYKQMDLKERKELNLMTKNGTRIKEIATQLGRDKSTIYRELRRNTVDVRIGYSAFEADNEAKLRKAKKVPILVKKEILKKKVIEKLKKGWSPEVISGRMRQQEHSDRVSHETIYTYIYSKIGNEEGLFKHLLRGQSKRNALKGRKSRRTVIPDRTSIHDRPQVINSREEFGHFEGDLTFNRGSQSINITTIVERKSRLTLLVKNDSKRSAVVVAGMFNKLGLLNPEVCKSITFDNGTEFTHHSILKKHMKMDTYFCDPSSPWQKGQVEKTNAMLHRYISKSFPLNSVSEKFISDVENKINNCPRKILGFKTPNEVFYDEHNVFLALRRLNAPGAAEVSP